MDADEDTRFDVYERSGGQTMLVSTGPAGGNGEFHAIFMRASADGGRAFFVTQESLVGDDGDLRETSMSDRAGRRR